MYHYSIEYLEDISHALAKESGLVGAPSYGAAIDKVIEFYGQENVFSVTLSELENPLTRGEVYDSFAEDPEEV